MRSGTAPIEVIDNSAYETVERLPDGVSKWELRKLGGRTYRVLPVINEDHTLNLQESEVYVIEFRSTKKGEEPILEIRKILTGERRGKALLEFLRQRRKSVEAT